MNGLFGATYDCQSRLAILIGIVVGFAALGLQIAGIASYLAQTKGVTATFEQREHAPPAQFTLCGNPGMENMPRVVCAARTNTLPTPILKTLTHLPTSRNVESVHSCCGH
jgi:hypothetical protein